MKYITISQENLDKLHSTDNYTVKTVSDLFNCNKATINTWIKKGKIKSKIHCTGIRIIEGKELIKYSKNFILV